MADAKLARHAADAGRIPDDTRVSMLLHSAPQHDPQECGGAPAPATVPSPCGLDGAVDIIEPTRTDEHAATDRRERGRDGARIRAPKPPPAATKESVQAEMRASASAARMVVRQRRWRASASGLDGAVDEVAEPRAETERALQPREREATPREAPKRIEHIYLRGADGSLRPFPKWIY